MKRAWLGITISCTLFALAFIAYHFSTPTLAAQEAITGDWTAKVRQTDQGPKLWLTMNSNRSEQGERRGWFNMSSDFPMQDFSGLNPNAGGNTQFSLMREAGTVAFTGLFQEGRGEVRFLPSTLSSSIQVICL